MSGLYVYILYFAQIWIQIMWHCNHDERWKRRAKREKEKETRCRVHKTCQFSYFPTPSYRSSIRILELSGDFALPGCSNQSRGWVRGPCPESLAKWSNQQGSMTMWSSRNPWRVDEWLLNPCTIRMGLDMLGVQYTHSPKMPVSP